MKAGIHRCALPLCNLQEDLRVCSQCKIAFYCGKDHQRRHWKFHRQECIPDHDRVFPGVSIISMSTPGSSQEAHLTSHNNNNLTMDKPVEENLSKNDPFAKKRSLEIGDDSYVDLTHLDLNREESSTSSKFELQDGGTASDRTASIMSIEQDTFSDQILRTHSYNLTPLKHEDEADVAEGKERHETTGNVEWQVGASEPSMPSGPSKYSAGNVGIKKQSKEWLEKFTNYVVKSMNSFGICVVDRVLGNERAEKILNEVKSLHQDGQFSDGQLVRTNKDRPVTKGAIRGDKIMWTDGVNPVNENTGYLISVMDTIIQMTNGHFENVNISTRTKAMIACYPGTGSGYVKHVDNPTEDGRCITCIYYLNKAWDSRKHGGLLRIYPVNQDRVANIEPKFDRILFFWSDRRNPHEVLPAYRTRYAITVWYFNPTEREKAKVKRRCVTTEISTKPTTTT